MENKLSKRLWFNILLFNFMGAVAWNVENIYFNTFLHNYVYANAAEGAAEKVMTTPDAISIMVGLSAFTAVATTFIMGTLSDKIRKRKIFISVGYTLWGIITATFGLISHESMAKIFNLTDGAQILLATVWAVIIMDVLMTFMGSTSNDSVFHAWVTDVTNTKTRPKVETAFVFIGFISMGVVMGIGSLAQGGIISYKAFFLGLGAVVTLCGILGFFLLEDPEPKTVKESNSNYWSDLFYGFRPSVIKTNSRLYLTLASVCLFSVAVQVFFPYLFIYLQEVIIPANSDLNLISAGVIIPAILAVVIMIAGIIVLMKISDKNKALGLVPSVILMAVGLFILSTTTNVIGVLFGVAPTVIGYLVLTIQLNAAIKDFIPAGKAGLFQGIRMIFVVLIPMVVGPFFGALAAKTSDVQYEEYGKMITLPSEKMFVYSAIITLLVFVPLIPLIKKGFETKVSLPNKRR